MIEAQIHMENAIVNIISVTQSFENLTQVELMFLWNSQVQPKLNKAKNDLSEAKDIRTKSWDYLEDAILTRNEINKWKERSRKILIPMLLTVGAIFITLFGKKELNYVSVTVSSLSIIYTIMVTGTINLVLQTI